jgi:hypothetical protein
MAFDIANVVGGVPEAALAQVRIGMAPTSESLTSVQQTLIQNRAEILARDCLNEAERIHISLGHRASELASMIVTALGRLAEPENN